MGKVIDIRAMRIRKSVERINALMKELKELQAQANKSNDSTDSD